VILRQHGVSGIGATVVIEDDMLLLLGVLDNLLGAGTQLIADLVDDRHDERCDDGEDPHGELLLQLLEDLR
jgi:hypothetical protein